MSRTAQPLSVLIGALGGEGGGVLADWLTQAAAASGYVVQRTSIPGVAQRTGATTYYLEILLTTREQLDGKEVVLALSPVPGHIDLMVASELLEAGRAVQGGLISPERTTLIASNHRILTVVEKSAMGDGRFDNQVLLDTLEKFSKRAIVFDMEAAARDAGTAISAVMLGAIAGSGVVPAARSAFETAIRSAGKGVETNLKGFAAGFAATTQAPVPTAGLRGRPVPLASRDAIAAIGQRFAPSVRGLIEEGYLRQVDYQNRRYADLYRERVEKIYATESAGAVTDELPVTAAVARFLALWMSYEDVIRVADLKSRRSRAQRVRAEVNARPDDLVRVIEIMKPGVEEWCAVLPESLAHRLRRWALKRGAHLNIGLHIKTSSLHGFLLLRLLAGLRWWRPRTSRYAEEQRLMERWLNTVETALTRDRQLALEIALCARLVKGYGETHARGKAGFLRIMDTLVIESAFASERERAQAVRQAREAALADPEGRALEVSLGTYGIAPIPPRTKPIVWHKPGKAPAKQASR